MIFAGNMLYAYKIDKPLNLSLILYDTCNICANIWRSSQSMMETFILHMKWYYIVHVQGNLKFKKEDHRL